jgi:arylsulfatase I/J
MESLLLSALLASPPHILHVIVDDFGWANTNYHREVSDPEIVTPNLDALVKEGILTMRHYVHPECTPSRTSFITGRLPMHSGQPGLCSPTSTTCGAPYKMGAIAEKLRSGGMVTHQVGKWDVGMATPTHTPVGRGFNTSLNYFGHGNYQWGQIEWGANGGGNAGHVVPPMNNASDPYHFVRDLWDSDKPAHAQSDRSLNDGIYEEMIFRERLTDIVMNHDTSLPLFLMYCARIAHYPIQAPIAYQQRPNIASIDVPHRLVYHAQVEFLDEQIGNLTAMFKQRGMWDNTLMVLTSDNGGYTKKLGPCSDGTDKVKGITCMSGEAGANNYPMRGGKYSLFEGGIRANSFISGGLLPAKVRGTTMHGVMHIADWWATYCHLAGVDPRDEKAAAQHPPLPPIDSINMWPLITGETSTSPREELFVTGNLLIQGDWKLIVGVASSASWPGPTYPNKSSVGNTLDQYTAHCSPPGTKGIVGSDGAAKLGPCLYNVGVSGDWTEHENVAASQATVVTKMYARLVELRKTIYAKPANASKPYEASCLNHATVFTTMYKGFYGPFCQIGPGPMPPGPPGNFTPAPLNNCTWVQGARVRPPKHTVVAANSKDDCCKQCGLDSACVIATFQCYADDESSCACHKHTYDEHQTVVKQANSTVCVTGRVPKPIIALTEEELLNYGV